MGSITVSGLGKAYRHYRRPAQRILEWFGASPLHELQWVLRDISFQVSPGEAVGLIGRNGAGKSTLLKLITGITSPSAGSVQIQGRHTALLELGLGFQPEFSGRQNVFMQAYLQGLSHQQVSALLPEIEAFAEIGDYFDRPVRIYSSGMQVRLAFSVATALRPELLIVDEALAVGDAYFQHKCFDRIRAFREQGTTLLFVSHDPGAVKSLCDRAVLLSQGRVAMDGNPADVLDYYNALLAPDTDTRTIQTPSLPAAGTRSGNGQLTIESVLVIHNGAQVQAVPSAAPVSIRIQALIHVPLPELTIGFLIKDRLGNDIFGTNTRHLDISLGPFTAGQTLALSFDLQRLNLGAGHYSITVAAHASFEHSAGNYDWWERAVVFQVLPAPGAHTIGVCHMSVSCHKDLYASLHSQP